MIKKEDVFLNEAYWRDMSDNELIEYCGRIFDYYRQEGFPYYPTDMETRKKEFDKLRKYDRSSLITEDGVIQQTMHGLGLAWSYFPHAFNVRCGNMMTPYEAFMDDRIFEDVIFRRLKMGTYISDSGIRKMLKIYSGVQAVSNFRPTAAAALYDRYAPNGVVWDMSCGWGGRLLGAAISGVKTYIGTEPAELTFEGLHDMAEDLLGDFDYWIFKTGSETYVPDAEMLDFCFTSPPYFDLEKYSDEDSQSYIRFPDREQWLNGYLRTTFENCYRGLKPNKYMAINIADKKGNKLEQDAVRIAEEVGFELVDTLKLALSNVNLRNKGNKFKYEPIYIFKK